jgi:hypothetical protein
MARQRTILTFEEGSAGAAIDASSAIRKPPKWDDSGSTLAVSGCRYTTNAYSGALAASLDSALSGGVVTVTAAAQYATGGGAWFKSITPPGSASDPLIGLTFFNSNPALSRGVGIYHKDGNLEARIGFTVLGSTPYVANRWTQFQLSPAGTWSLTDQGGSTLMAGAIAGASASPYESLAFLAQAGTTPGSLVIDDVWLWWDGGPAVRLYPRDDGRGMSSAPRLWPPPKNRRIVGNYP